MYNHLEYLYVKPAEYNLRKLSLPVYFLATPSANEASSIGKQFEHIKSNVFISVTISIKNAGHINYVHTGYT